MKRTLKGIQALRDDLEADGEEYRTNGANGIQKSILKLKGKSNVLERTIEKTQSTITDVEKGLQSQITQTATEIRTEVKIQRMVYHRESRKMRAVLQQKLKGHRDRKLNLQQLLN